MRSQKMDLFSAAGLKTLASQRTIQPFGTDPDVVHEYEFELQMQD